MNNPTSRIVVVADGSFPVHEIPLRYIKNAEKLICCDGSARTVVAEGYTPDAIVGDMDSLTEDIAIKFADRIFPDEEQETNDLTKAVKWCNESGYRDLVIVGATGKREDHTIGNVSLLAEYVRMVKVVMSTDTGFFMPFLRTTEIPSFAGQQVSIFSIDPETEITTHGLRYPLKRSKIKNWWEATLNESLGDHFGIEFKNGRIILFLKYKE